jgi:hypothetical protein
MITPSTIKTQVKIHVHIVRRASSVGATASCKLLISSPLVSFLTFQHRAAGTGSR